MARINWKYTKSRVSNSTKRYLINRSAQGYPSRLTLSCSVEGRFSGSSRRRSGRRRHPNNDAGAAMPPPPRRQEVLHLSGSLLVWRDFALFSLWSYTHSRIQPPTRPDLLESSTKTTAGTDVRVHRLLRPKSFPFRDRVVAFVPRSFIRAGKPRDQSHDVDCTPSSIRQISRYLHHDLKISSDKEIPM